MSVLIKSVNKDSVSCSHGVFGGCRLESINGRSINDVLDYRFYGAAKRLHCVFKTPQGKEISFLVKSEGNPDILGLNFETYLMDKVKTCRNKCIFCFVDQMPKGERNTLYFKDDDYRLCFLFGNYVTLTNFTDDDVNRIIEMKIEPINISIQTMNPELRVKMLGNRFAGDSLKYIDKLYEGGIKMNVQFVLCPGINDGEELVSSLEKLRKYGDSILSCALVPVGLTSYRDGLFDIHPYTKKEAENVIKISDRFNEKYFGDYGRYFANASDEFFLKAEHPFPNIEYYGNFDQLDNGVGMWQLTKYEFKKACDAFSEKSSLENESALIITGVAASELMNELAEYAGNKVSGLKVDVLTVVNDFFGHEVTVAGLVTASDIINQAGDVSSYDRVVIPDVMLKSEDEKIFLDSVSLEELEKRLNHKITVDKPGGVELFKAVAGLSQNG